MLLAVQYLLVYIKAPCSVSPKTCPLPKLVACAIGIALVLSGPRVLSHLLVCSCGTATTTILVHTCYRFQIALTAPAQVSVRYPNVFLLDVVRQAVKQLAVFEYGVNLVLRHTVTFDVKETDIFRRMVQLLTDIVFAVFKVRNVDDQNFTGNRPLT